jgi:hypothetical protein
VSLRKPIDDTGADGQQEHERNEDKLADTEDLLGGHLEPDGDEQHRVEQEDDP